MAHPDWQVAPRCTLPCFLSHIRSCACIEGFKRGGVGVDHARNMRLAARNMRRGQQAGYNTLPSSPLLL
eukprot:50335-Chlamydomonas_euryale.AAC.2